MFEIIIYAYYIMFRFLFKPKQPIVSEPLHFKDIFRSVATNEYFVTYDSETQISEEVALIEFKKICGSLKNYQPLEDTKHVFINLKRG